MSQWEVDAYYYESVEDKGWEVEVEGGTWAAGMGADLVVGSRKGFRTS